MYRPILMMRWIFLALIFSATVAQAAPTAQHYAARLLEQLPKTTAVSLGIGPRVVSVFFDPNCPYCHELYDAAKHEVGREGLQFRWIPVAVLAPGSEGKAAAILQAPDRAKALARNENDFNENPEAGSGGGIVPAGQITVPSRDALKRNLQVLHQAGPYFAFPLMVWRDRSGQPQMCVHAISTTEPRPASARRQPRAQRGLALHAQRHTADHPVLDQNEAGRGHHAELRGQRGLLENVDLVQMGKLRLQAIDHGAGRFAGAAVR